MNVKNEFKKVVSRRFRSINRQPLLKHRVYIFQPRSGQLLSRLLFSVSFPKKTLQPPFLVGNLIHNPPSFNKSIHYPFIARILPVKRKKQPPKYLHRKQWFRISGAYFFGVSVHHCAK
jgi:hypothetical protein